MAINKSFNYIFNNFYQIGAHRIAFVSVYKTLQNIFTYLRTSS